MPLGWAGFVGALKVDLDAHADLADTTITTFPVAVDLRGNEGVVMVTLQGGHEFHSMGPRYRDGFNVECRLWSRSPDTSATAEPGTVSRTRCETMLDAVVDVLEDTSSTIYGHVGRALVSSWSATPQQWEDGGWVWHVEFTIAALTVPV